MSILGDENIAVRLIIIKSVLTKIRSFESCGLRNKNTLRGYREGY